MPQYSKTVPTVGRIVHVYYGSEDNVLGPAAGIIDEIDDQIRIACRAVLPTPGTFGVAGVFDALKPPERQGLKGPWAEWPPFVPAGVPKSRKPSNEEMATRFNSHAANGDQKARMYNVRFVLREVAVKLIAMTPASREQERAVDLLEEAVFYFNAAISRHSDPAEGVRE